MALTRIASQEWGPFGITTNTILPVVHSDPMDWYDWTREAAAALPQRIPVRRYGWPYEDCSPIVAFLVSDDASFVTGASIVADGGFSAGLSKQIGLV